MATRQKSSVPFSSKTAIIYLHSESPGDALQAQRRLCREFAYRNNFNIHSEYFDDARLKFAGLISALEFAKAHRVNALIVQDARSLASDVFGFCTILSDLREKKVNVLLASPDFKGVTEGKLVDTILTNVKALENKLFKKKG